MLGYNLKNDRMILVSFKSKSFNTWVIQVYASSTDAEGAEVEWLCDGLQDLVELTPKNVLFIKDNWNAKVEGQAIPGIIGEFGLELKKMKQGKG